MRLSILLLPKSLSITQSHDGNALAERLLYYLASRTAQRRPKLDN